MTGKEILFAAVGVGDFAIEKARGIDPIRLRKNLPKRLARIPGRVEKVGTKTFASASRAYKGLVKRGETTVRGIRNAAPTRRAVTQAKNARRQTKAAVTSSQKAAQTTVEAVREAATSST